MSPDSRPKPAPRFTAPPAGRPLDARLRETLRACRPTLRVVGVQIPQIVYDAQDDDQPLVTSKFARAIDALCAMPGVPLERLEAFADDFRSHVRARRGVRGPDLGTAMRLEEQAGVALNLREWCGDEPRTLGWLLALRADACTQLRTTQDLIDAADREIAQQLAPTPSGQQQA